MAQIEQHDYLVATLRSVDRADDVDAISEVYPIGVNEFLDNWSQFFSTLPDVGCTKEGIPTAQPQPRRVC